MKTKDIIIVILVAAISILGTYIFIQKDFIETVTKDKDVKVLVSNFDECVAAGNPVMESHPRQCVHSGKTFTQVISSDNTTPSTQIVEENDPETTEESKVVGGDKDEHGCIGSAGYVWCEEKSKCLRPWEEVCVDDKEKGIVSALATKHNKNHADVSIEIHKEEGNYVKGMVQFEPSGEIGNAGMFLATKVGGNWVIVYDGHGVADCDDLINNYGFPKSVLVGMCD